MKFIHICIISLSLVGCAQSGYKTFYKPYVDTKTLTDVELLAEGQEPKVFGTDDFEKDTKILRSKQYFPIGFSSFNGGYEGEGSAIAQAKRVGATIVLVNSKFTNTQTTTSTLFLPDNKTTYHSGSAYGNTSYNSAYGGYLGSSATNANYSGTSTTYGTKAVPITNQQQRYDQTALFFIKNTKKLKFGVFLKELTPDQRTVLERNTGVLIDVVVENSPAFISNVLAGDILIKIDNNLVINGESASKLMSNVNPNAKSSTLTIIRNKKEKIINIIF